MKKKKRAKLTRRKNKRENGGKNIMQLIICENFEEESGIIPKFNRLVTFYSLALQNDIIIYGYQRIKRDCICNHSYHGYSLQSLTK